MLDIIQSNLVEFVCVTFCGVLTTLAGLVFNRSKSLFRAVRANSHDKLYRYGNFYITSGQITMDELHMLEEIYSGYHGLGGNGTGTAIIQRCRRLPLVNERTVWNPYYTHKCESDINEVTTISC